MNERDRIELLNTFPEAPNWVLDRDWALKDARNAMIERRRTFPATAPMTAEKVLATKVFGILKHGGLK